MAYPFFIPCVTLMPILTWLTDKLAQTLTKWL